MQGQLTPSRTIPGHTNTVCAVAFFKDGRRAVTGSTDCVLQVWDMQTGVLVEGPFKGHKEGVLSVAVSPDDRRIVSGGWDENVMIWDVERKYMPNTLVQHTATVNSVCFSPDGKKFASGSDDETVVLWDGDTCAVLAILPHSSYVCSVAFGPDNLKLATGSDSTIRVWHIKNAEVLLKINAHRWTIRSVVWLPDGQQLVSASGDRTIKFWNSLNGSQIGQPCIGHADSIVSLAASSDGSFIATASDDKTVRLWSTETYQQIGRSLQHTAWVPFVAICPNMELLVSATDKMVLLWSIKVLFAKIAPRLSTHLDQANLSHDVQKLDDAPDLQIPQLSHQYTDPSETDRTIREAIQYQLENAPLRAIDTSTGRLCSQEAQIEDFLRSIEYKELLSSMTRAPLQMEPINEVVVKYFSWVMLSHRWGPREPLLHDVQTMGVYNLGSVGETVKLQRFCITARDAGYRWAWSDTCCIDSSNSAEVSRSVNSMFVWYHYSALTIVYLSDVPPSTRSGALASSSWNTRGWTFQELLASAVVLFYQADWSLYLGDRSPNHKESSTIMQELADSTGINIQSLVTFRPGMVGAREKLQWASTRVTTLQEDVAYSLFGIFGIHLPVLYGEKSQNALGRLLQEIIARSGDISALEWVGKPSDFNSCLPASITSYGTSPYTPQPLLEDEIQTSVAMLQDAVAADSASNLYTLLDNLDPPRFANSRLQLPCIAFLLTEIRRVQDQGGHYIYDVKADGLQDLQITTTDRLLQFSPDRPLRQMKFYLIRPWNRDDIPWNRDDIEFIEELQGLDDWPQSPSDDLPLWPARDHEMVNSESYRALRLIARLGQSFSALLLAQQRIGEYKRVASDYTIIAQVKNMVDVDSMMNIRTFEIL